MAALNDPDAGPTVRRPRLRVLTNGAEIPGAVMAEVQANSNYQADKFSLQFAMNADPAYGLKWWASQSRLMIDMQIAIDGDAWVSMITGQIDQLHLEPNRGLVQAEGRDLTSNFIEARTQEAFLNQTSSDIATTLAGRHGMEADVTATTSLVNRFYGDDYTQITAGQFSRVRTEWDLLTYLAQQENFDAYVTGNTLHFKPKPADDADVFLARWQSAPMRSNVIDLRLERSLTLSRDIEVQVRSWNSQQKRSFTRMARRTGAKSANAQQSSNQVGTDTQRYVYVIPNMTEDQAQKKANSLLADLSEQERKITFAMPGDLTLTTRNKIQLAGTGSDFDQSYFIEDISRAISFNGGFVMHVSAKNASAQSQVVL